MSDIKAVADAAGKMAKMSLTKWLIVVVILAIVSNTILTQLGNNRDAEENNKMYKQIVILNQQNGELIKDIVNSKLIKKCVVDNYDLAEEQWRETKTIIGKTFEKNGIDFPHEMNESFMKYDVKRAGIKDCLIFPEK